MPSYHEGAKRLKPGADSFVAELDDLLVDQAVADAITLQPAIEAGTASTDQVLQWFYAHDPIGRADNKLFLESIESGRIDEAVFSRAWGDVRQARVFENAAYILINSVIDPAEQADATELRVDEASESVLWSVFPAQPNTEQLNLLFVAVECLASSVAADIATRHHGDESSAASIGFNGRVALFLSEYIYKRSINAARNTDDSAEMIELTDQAVNAKLWETFGFTYPMAMSAEIAESNLSNVVSQAKGEAFRDLIDALNLVYVQQLGEYKPVIKGTAKGNLHEAIWAIDGNLALMLSQELSGSYVQPVRSRQDKPRINHPKQKRGFDAVVVVPKPDSLIEVRTIPIQQKSGNGRDHTDSYHQRIFLAQEQNFQDANVRRLKSKLNAYNEWIESGFDASLGKSIYDKYVLGSVKEAMPVIKKVASQDDSEYLGGSLEGVDRATRRRVARSLAKLMREKR